MAYANASSGPSSEVLRLQQEITREVNNDAQHIANSVFGKVGNMPDMARVPDSTLDSRYRMAYLNNDRPYLVSEAQRDPEQFIEVSRRLGVKLPGEVDQAQPVQPAMPSQPAMPPPQPSPLTPMAMPAPVSPPVLSLPPAGPVPPAPLPVAPAIAPLVPGGM